MKPILVDSLYVNMGGGLNILNLLIKTLISKNTNFVLIKDVRCPKLEVEEKVKNIIVLAPSLTSRHSYYVKHKNDYSVVLCFGNVPPTVKLDIPVYTYFHNVSFLKTPSDYTVKQKIRAFIKKTCIKILASNTTCWLVQTSYTSKLVKENLASKDQTVFEYPFYYIPKNMNVTPKSERGDYVFIGEYTFAKGHEYLVDAWVQLAQLGYKMKLHLTVSDRNFTLKIDEAKRKGANIVNHGHIMFSEVVKLYNTSKATVYPSLNESLGLGIVEAVEAGCDVIGSDLPYMHSVCDPSITFEPQCVNSIVQAIEQYENMVIEPTKLKIRSMENDLVDFLMSKQK